MAGTLIGNEMPNLLPKRTQVYMATHKLGEGDQRLPLMSRSFISFSYGGKFIEDFGFIATISNDRLQKNIYANFEDDITAYEAVDGQYYWGTHFINNGFNFVLSTDGITEVQLNEFKHWFKPGFERELILAENPNRAIMARVAAVPSYSFIPFEEKTTINIAGTQYDTSTTLYKGDINLSLVSDEPFWYSRNIFIDQYYDTTTDDKFNSENIGHSATNNTAATLQDKDFLKVIIEDNIPHISMIQTNMILSGDRYASVVNEESNYSSIIGTDSDEAAARIGETDLNYNAVIGPLEAQNISITPNGSQKYLYYSGTAPSKPIITFTLTPQLNEAGFIKYPLNTYYKENGVGYNTFSIGSQTLKFTLPSVWLGYNQALAIVSNVEVGDLVAEVRQNLILGVHEYYSRGWAIKCLDDIIDGNDTIPSNFITSFFTEMKKFLTINGQSDGEVATGKFIFNSQKGIATGVFSLVGQSATMIDGSYIDHAYLEGDEILVGDMLRSNFITITDRNYPDNNNYIKDINCTPITTNYPGGLQDVVITFKNMYY